MPAHVVPPYRRLFPCNSVPRHVPFLTLRLSPSGIPDNSVNNAMNKPERPREQFLNTNPPPCTRCRPSLSLLSLSKAPAQTLLSMRDWNPDKREPLRKWVCLTGAQRKNWKRRILALSGSSDWWQIRTSHPRRFTQNQRSFNSAALSRLWDGRRVLLRLAELSFFTWIKMAALYSD